MLVVLRIPDISFFFLNQVFLIQYEYLTKPIINKITYYLGMGHLISIAVPSIQMAPHSRDTTNI